MEEGYYLLVGCFYSFLMGRKAIAEKRKRKIFLVRYFGII